jgi:hypothetical protein
MSLLYQHSEIGLGVVKLSGALLGSQADEALDLFLPLTEPPTPKFRVCQDRRGVL